MKLRAGFKMSDSSVKAFIDQIEERIGMITNNAYSGMVAIVNKADTRAYETCPIDTGTLRAAQFSDVAMSGDTVEGVIGYGGPNNQINPKTFKWVDDYAVAVHESYKITLKDRKKGGTAKWLEKAINSYAGFYLPIYSAYMQGALELRPMEETLEQAHANFIEVAETKLRRKEMYRKSHPYKKEERIEDVFERRYRELHPNKYE